MRKLTIFVLCMLFLFGYTVSLKSVTVVDEPSVRLEAELNLHYKTFSDVKFSKEYIEKWLYKYNYLPDAEEMSDTELFNALDLEQAGLKQVKSVMKNNDLDNASIYLSEYFSKRTAPCPLDLGTLSPSRKKKVLEIADECLTHPDFPNIQWNREKYGRGCKDSRWNWVSNLYSAYRYTEDMKYLKGTMEMFSFWHETVRPPAGVPKIWLTPSFIDNPWGTHISSYRLATLASLNEILSQTELNDIPTNQRTLLYKSVIEHARFLIAANPGFRSGNIQIHHMLNLLEAGVYFPEFKESSEWVDYAWQNLLKHARLDFLSDFGYYERAPGYNNAVIRFWRRILELSRYAGLETPDWLEPKLKKAQEWTMKVYTPTLNMPPVGDGGIYPENFAVKHLIDGALLFPCPEFKYFVEDYPDKLEKRAEELFGDNARKALMKLQSFEAKKPDYTSVLLPETGWAVMRSGWDRDALYMLFDFGSNEPWHCHRDGLGFSIFAYGSPLITDCGMAGSYDTDRCKEWYKETISHNLVTINGMSQRKVTNGRCDSWVSTSICDFADAEHDGYKHLGAYCRRKITFVKPSYWIITDNITEKMCQTTGYHECKWLAHFQPTELTIDEKTKQVNTNNENANVLLAPVLHEGLEVVQSKGWTATPEGEAENAPYIGFTGEGDPPIDFEVIVYPYKGDKKPEITVEQLDLGEDSWRCKGLKITSSVGTDYYLESLKGDYYYVLQEETKFLKYGEFSFDGEMALIREKDGKFKSILLVGGSCLKRSGNPLVECSNQIEYAEILFSDGTASVKGEFAGQITVSLPNGNQIETKKGQ